MKKRILFVLAGIALCAGIYVYFVSSDHHKEQPDLRPIRPDEFVYEKLGTMTCGHTTPELNKRCTAAGGNMMRTFYVMNTDERYGCFPSGETLDKGKLCTSDTMCEGFCSSYSDTTEGRGVVKFCTSFKKPLFASVEKIDWFDKGCPEE